ncbi:hypothetical protein ACFT9M_29230 [Micromonospora purpureochromogenes]|uniref:hypothetical protein n=1 Tax=Micromonospora purpureochromogenes TaxID=47872 RepID=UPI00362B3748
MWVGLLGTVAACTVGAIVNGDDGSDIVPPPTAQERGDTVPILQRSTASQGVCYGWVLKDHLDYGDPLSVGSNLGDGVPVEDNPGCPRWLQVTARIYYPGESSESNDSAYVDVTGSADVTSAQLLRIENGLARLGLTDEVFIDDPGWATTRAAVMLPLLAVEAGLVEPVATPAAAAAAPSPLPAAGNDLWRDRWGYLLAAAGLLLVTALLVTVGLVQRRRQRRGVGPAQRAGAETAATRTPERA